MPIVLPQVSYAPLYQATQLKGGARQALHGAQSLDLISRIRALQRQQRTTDTVLGIANLVLQLGNTVYGIFEQQQFEKAKGQMHDLRLDMQQKVQTYIDNNQLSWETDAQGNKVIHMPPEFDEWYDQSLHRVEDAFKSYPRVRSWATDELSRMHEQGTEAALTYGRGYAAKQALTEFNRNLGNAMTDAVNAGDFAAVEGVLESARSWLGDAATDNVLADHRQQFELRVAEKTVRTLTTVQGYGAAVEYVQGLERSAEETQALLAAAANQNGLVTTVRDAQEQAAFDDFLKKALDPAERAKLSRQDILDYALAVGDRHRAEVLRYLDGLDKTAQAGQEARRELEQDVAYSRMSAAILDWDGTGEPPFSFSDLATAVEEGRITVEQRNNLETDLRTVMQELAKGERTPEQLQQHRNASDLRSRMYAALDELKDPAAAVTQRTIDEALGVGKISVAQHDELLQKREALREEYAQRLEANRKARGPLHEDPAKVAQLWRIVLNDQLSSTEKYEKARSFLFNGVPGERWYQITNHIEELNNRPDWKSRMDALNRFYSAAITAMDKDDDERKAATLEQAAAGQAMMRIFRQYPDAPDKWDQALQSLLNPATKKELQRMIQGSLQARFPGIGRAPEWESLETAREQLPAEFAASPGLQMQHAIRAPEIAESEQKILAGAGVTIVDQYQAPSGEWIYSTVPIPRDANGQPQLEPLRKAGNLYTVRSVVRGGRIMQQPLRYR